MTDFEKNINRNVSKDLFNKIRDHKYGNGDIYDHITYGEVSAWFTWNRDAHKIVQVGPRGRQDFGTTKLDWEEDAKLPQEFQFSKKLTTDIVFVGLNMSRDILPPKWPPFSNARNHIRIIKTFFGTEAEGGYYTDIIKPDKRIKDKVENNRLNPSKGNEVMEFLIEHPDIQEEHIKIFMNELDFIGAQKPLLIVFGRDAEKVLQQAFNKGNLDRNQFHGVVFTDHYTSYPKGYDLGYTKIVSSDLAPYITILNDEKKLEERWADYGIEPIKVKP
jgi:hypothetical protein